MQDAELPHQTLYAAAGFADQNSAKDILVLARVLADDEKPCRAVEAYPMEDRTPLGAEVRLRVSVLAGVVPGKRAERFVDVTEIEIWHMLSFPPCHRVRYSKNICSEAPGVGRIALGAGWMWIYSEKGRKKSL